MLLFRSTQSRAQLVLPLPRSPGSGPLEWSEPGAGLHQRLVVTALACGRGTPAPSQTDLDDAVGEDSG